MAAPKGFLALLATDKTKGPRGSSPPSREPGDPASSPPDLTIMSAALKSMWANMKAGDFDAAALDFHDAYMACQQAEDEEGADDEGGADAEDDYSEEM